MSVVKYCDQILKELMCQGPLATLRLSCLVLPDVDVVKKRERLTYLSSGASALSPVKPQPDFVTIIKRESIVSTFSFHFNGRTNHLMRARVHLLYRPPFLAFYTKLPR